VSPDPTLQSVEDYARAARARLDPVVATFLDSGNADGLTLARNRSAFGDIELNAHRFVDVATRSTAIEVLGSTVAAPVLIAPTGLHEIAHPDGELATTRAAGAAGTVMTTGTMATRSVEEVAATATGPVWFQLYHLGEDVLEVFVRRAEAAGCAAICITLDVPVQIRGREHDRRNGFRASKGRPLANFDTARGHFPASLSSDEVRGWKRRPLRPVSLELVAWLRTITDLPLIAKGIMLPEDARRAAEAGVDAIYVSNHGGRECDGLPATIDVLAEIVDAVASSCEVYLDGGIRRGSDVVKALALGAQAVLIGRPFWWGLAVGGEDGVAHVLELLRFEIEEVLAGIGCTDVRDLDRRYLRDS
jgi:4-hydroxymandelate oxidase